MVGLARLELATSRLSSVRSNQLSYKPDTIKTRNKSRNFGSSYLRKKRYTDSRS